MIHVPVWLQLAAVALQAYGLYKAGDGWAHGWLVAAAQTALWAGFAVASGQWLLLSGPAVLVPVQLRNAWIRSGRNGGEVSMLTSRLLAWLKLAEQRRSGLDGP